MPEPISDAETAHRTVRVPGAIIAEAAQCCICKLINSAEGIMSASGFVVIQSDPAVTRVTMSMPKANASMLLGLSGPVAMCRKQTR
jgi:hypothetical protein